VWGTILNLGVDNRNTWVLRYNHTKRKGYKALTTKQVEEAARFWWLALALGLLRELDERDNQYIGEVKD